MSPPKRRNSGRTMKKAKAPAKQNKKKTSSAKKKPGSSSKKVSTARVLKGRTPPASARTAKGTIGRAAKSKAAASGEKALAARRKDEKALLDLYERGIKALYSKNYQHAMELFEKLIENYPEEIELTDRARNFIKISLSQGATRKQHPPKTAEE